MERERDTYWRLEGILLDESLDPVTGVDSGDVGAFGFDLFIKRDHLLLFF